MVNSVWLIVHRTHIFGLIFFSNFDFKFVENPLYTLQSKRSRRAHVHGHQLSNTASTKVGNRVRKHLQLLLQLRVMSAGVDSRIGPCCTGAATAASGAGLENVVAKAVAIEQRGRAVAASKSGAKAERIRF